MLESRAFARSFFQPMAPQQFIAAREGSEVGPASLPQLHPCWLAVNTSFSKCQQRMSYQELQKHRILPLTEVDDPSQVHGIHLLYYSFFGKSKKHWRRKLGVTGGEYFNHSVGVMVSVAQPRAVNTLWLTEGCSEYLHEYLSFSIGWKYFWWNCLFFEVFLKKWFPS